MPFLKARHKYVQRVREAYGCSDPFFAVMSLADMRRFSLRIIEGRWQERVAAIRERLGMNSTTCATDEQERAFIDERLKTDPLDPLSSRLACAHEGRYWTTARIWSRQVPWYPEARSFARDDESRVLMPNEVTLLLHSRCDESGWRALYKSTDDIKDGPKSLARTVMEWSTKIEEAWSDQDAGQPAG